MYVSRRQLLCDLARGGALPRPGLRLRHVFASGEALPVATAAAFVAAFPGVPLHNVLSTTEVHS